MRVYPPPSHEPGDLPDWAFHLLERLIPERSRDVILGDFAEIYRYTFEEEGRFAASRWYVAQLFKSLPSFLSNNLYYGGDMLRNYVKIGVRQLVRTPFYATLNIAGLAMGMAACLLIFQYVAFEYSFDRFHENGDNLYRATWSTIKNGEVVSIEPDSWFSFGPKVLEDVPEVKNYARWHPSYMAGITVAFTDAGGARQVYNETGINYVDASLLTMFTFPMLEGDPETALTSPKNVVLTRSVAERYFGSESALGKTLDIYAWVDGSYTVTGIVEDVPAESHMQFDILLPMVDLLENAGQYQDRDGWGWSNFFTYLELHPGADKAEAETKITALVREVKQNSMERRGVLYTMGLQPLADIRLFSDFPTQYFVQGNYRTVYIFVIIALFVLIIAWINYINLATARAMKRAMEVGVRKAVGARHTQLITQFLVESVLTNVLALALAIGLAFAFMPYLNTLAGADLSTDIWQDVRFWGVLLGVFGGGALLASLYPAFLLSSFRPAVVLKGALGGGASKAKLRQALVVFQFAASIALLIGTFIVYQQVQHMRTAELGLAVDQVVAIQEPSVFENRETRRSMLNGFSQEALRLSAVESITMASELPGNDYSLGARLRKAGDDVEQAVPAYYNRVDHRFLEVFDIDVLAGRGFTEGSTPEGAVLITETGVQQLGFPSNEEAIDQTIFMASIEFTILGVVEDYHWFSVAQETRPMLLGYASYNSYYAVKLQTENLAETVASLEAIFQTTFPGNPFTYFFLDSTFDAQYQNDQRFGTLFAVFAGFALLVACLGLIGLASFTIMQRTKEIAVRKVFGASATTLARLVISDFVKLVLIALVLVAPLMYWAADVWLATFAMRIDLHALLFIGPGLVVLLIALLTVSYHTTAVVLTNPSQSLRHD